MTKLLCLDFDCTCTKTHYSNYLKNTMCFPGKQSTRQQTPKDIENIQNAIKLLLNDPNTGIKNQPELTALIKNALNNGNCVAITSFTDYPEAVELMLEQLDLNKTERESIYIACYLPYKHISDSTKGKRLDLSNGKNQHILEALKHFQNKDNYINKIILVDDNDFNVEHVNDCAFINGIEAMGILVDATTNAEPLYITETRLALRLKISLEKDALIYRAAKSQEQKFLKEQKTLAELLEGEDDNTIIPSLPELPPIFSISQYSLQPPAPLLSMLLPQPTKLHLPNIIPQHYRIAQIKYEEHPSKISSKINKTHHKISLPLLACSSSEK